MANARTKKGLQFSRRFTKDGVSPFDQFEYDYRDSVIKNPNGEKVFEMTNVEVPKQWSQIATDILAQKYFRKAGVPQADGTLGRETTVKQVAHRMANCWRVWGERYGYFATTSDAQVFYEELVYSILNQACVPNSPQWFNTGLHESYGITGGAQGHYYVDPTDKQLKRSTSAYERPQPHACFILSVSDDLVNEGGIMDLWTREARIFKYGSGVGTNFSQIRGANEKLSGGGSSSGLMSFLKIGDRAAGAIKSGGTTRRAAKMVCLDLDHPEIMSFINWKKDEEKKYNASFAGYFPAKNPKYSMMVVVYTPHGKYYGGSVAGPVFRNVVEKVHNLKLDLNKAINQGFQLVAVANLPKRRIGYKKDFEKVFEYVGIEYKNKSKSNWVAVDPFDNKMLIDKKSIIKSEVPDVRGMGARDAVYVLESLGLLVELEGEGQVRRQSIKPGANATEKKIKIYLD